MLAVFFGTNYTLLQVIEHYWLIFPVALLTALVSTPICHRLALRFKVVDYPDATVKTHTKPTAYLGGVAILAGVLAGLAIGFYVLYEHKSHVLSGIIDQSTKGYDQTYPNWLMLGGIAFGAIIACLVGLLDDLLDLAPWKKLLGQTIAAIVLLAVGVRPNLGHMFGYIGIDLPANVGLILDVPVVLFFVLGASNSLNLLDGLDGLCAGVTAIITITFLLLALTLATWAHSPVGDPIRLIVCLALVGATLGFLPMNRHPARIFMGDAGSMLLGFVSGALMILFLEQFGRWSIAAVVIFGLPILDTAVAIVRRFLNKKPLFVSDRGHIYDQFMDRGWPLKATVTICYVLAGIYALAGLLVSQIRLRHAAVVFVVVVVFSGYLVWRGGFLHIKAAEQPKGPEPGEEPADD